LDTGENDQASLKKRGYDLSQLIEKNDERKNGKKKRKKGKQQDAEEIFEDNFAINVDDQRFSALFDNPSFAIDPTDRSFKSTEAMEKLLEEKHRRRLDARTREEDEVRKQRMKLDQPTESTDSQNPKSTSSKSSNSKGTEKSSMDLLMARLKRRGLQNNAMKQ